MDEISDQMRGMVAQPPPTRIDVDSLVRGEQRRRRNLRWTATGAGLAVMALALTASMLPGIGGPGPAAPAAMGAGAAGGQLCAPVVPSGPPDIVLPNGAAFTPLGAEDPEETAARLSDALDDAFAEILPEGVSPESSQDGCERAQFQFQSGTGRWYVDLFLTRGDERNQLEIDVDFMIGSSDVVCVEGMPGTCRVTRSSDGGKVVTRQEPQPGVPGASLWVVDVLRADRTRISVQMRNGAVKVETLADGTTRSSAEWTSPEMLLDLEQLVALSDSPGLVLMYP